MPTKIAACTKACLTASILRLTQDCSVRFYPASAVCNSNAEVESDLNDNADHRLLKCCSMHLAHYITRVLV